jgi:subtilisin family serine protease
MHSMYRNSLLGCLMHLLLIAMAHGRGLQKADRSTRNVLVTMVAGTDTAIQQAFSAMQDAQSSDAGLQRTALHSSAGREMMVQMLEENAATSQAAVFSLLTGNVTAASNDTDSTTANLFNSANQQYASATSFWITNQVYIKGATKDLIAQLRSMPSVASVDTEIMLSLPPDEKSRPLNRSGATLQSVQWGISNIGANQVWNRFNGKGVTVGVIDTGARYDLICRPPFKAVQLSDWIFVLLS